MKLALLWLIVLVGFSTEASFGFGATVITVTLASQLLPIDFILPSVVPVNLVLSAYMVARYHHAVDRRLLFRGILPAMSVGVGVGLVLMSKSSDGSLKLAFAIFVVALSVLELKRLVAPGEPTGSGGSAAATRPVAGPLRIAMLFGAGVIHGLFGSGGPLVVYVAGREIEDKRAFRSTLGALWITMGSVLLVGYAASGLVTASTARTSALLAPTVVLAVVIGERVHHTIAERPFRIGVFALLIVAGTALAWSCLR